MICFTDDTHSAPASTPAGVTPGPGTESSCLRVGSGCGTIATRVFFALPVACRHVFQGVHQLLQFSSSAEGAGRPWQPEEKRYCKLVFIGKNLDRKELNDAFNACLVAAA